jgi:hypothetical protein
MPKVTPNETLTTPLVYATEAPFPTIRVSEKDPADVDETGDDLSVQYEPSPTEKVQVQVCSELSFFTRPFDLFDNAGPSSKETQRKLTLTHDSNGQPIVFAISNTGVCFQTSSSFRYYVNHMIKAFTCHFPHQQRGSWLAKPRHNPGA